MERCKKKLKKEKKKVLLMVVLRGARQNVIEQCNTLKGLSVPGMMGSLASIRKRVMLSSSS